MFLPLVIDATDFDADSPGAVNIGDPMPANTLLVGFIVRVKTAFNSDATVTLGDNADADLYADASVVDLQNEGIYEVLLYEPIAALTQARAYLTLDGADVGVAEVFVILRNT